MIASSWTTIHIGFSNYLDIENVYVLYYNPIFSILHESYQHNKIKEFWSLKIFFILAQCKSFSAYSIKDCSSCLNFQILLVFKKHSGILIIGSLNTPTFFNYRKYICFAFFIYENTTSLSNCGKFHVTFMMMHWQLHLMGA